MELWIYGVVLLACCSVGILAQTPASNPCDSSPCQNGQCAKSSWRTNGYYCSCRTGYIGDNCEHESLCVNDNPCKNGARCYATKYRDQFYGCSCTGGWYGRNCTLESPCVNGNPCQNGGRCSASEYRDKNYYCRCEGGWYGKNCTLESACVKEKPCQNGAWCYTSSSTDINYRCTCRGSYYGVNCTKVSPCKDSNPCQNGGRCVTASYYDEGYRCSCAEGFVGKHCDKRDPCKSEALPCQNGGTCSSYVAGNEYGYSCSCPTTHVGERCEKENPCISNPCINGGTCSSYSAEYFYCQCITGFRGQRCETKECPVKLTCRSNYTRTNDLSECVKQEELDDNMLESCYSRRETAIVESRSCDCTVSDYTDTKTYKMRYGPYQGSLRCFSADNMALVTCNNRTLECANKIRQAARVFYGPNRNCSENMVNLKSEIQKCHDDFLAGRVDFSGCEIFKTAYETIQQHINLYLKLACTDCDVSSIGRECYVAQGFGSTRTTYCENAAAMPKVIACFKDAMNANPACAGVTETVVNYMEKTGPGNEKSKQICTEVTKYEKKLEEYGCETPQPTTITKRSTKDFEDEPFSHLLYI